MTSRRIHWSVTIVSNFTSLSLFLITSSQKAPLYSRLTMLYPVELPDIHGIEACARFDPKQAGDLERKYTCWSGKHGYRVASPLYSKSWNCTPFHPAANLFDMVLRLKRQNSAHLILASFLILNSALWKQTQFRLNATETDKYDVPIWIDDEPGV